MNKRRLSQQNILEGLSQSATRWIGSTSSIIVHTILFVGIFVLRLFGVALDQVLLILTTLVSLEAIYLAIFIQMTVNRNTQSLEEVEEDIDKLQEDVEDIEDEVKDLGDDLEEIEEDLEQIQEDDADDDIQDMKTRDALERIQTNLQVLLDQIEHLKKPR